MTTSILLISSNHLITQSVIASLSEDIVHVDSAEKGLSFLTIKWDLIILDLSIHDKDGLETLETIKKSDSIAEVIVIADKSETTKCIQAMRLGAYSYLEHPVNPTSLKLLLHQIMEQSEDLKKIETIAREAFLDNIDERITLLQELIQTRRDQGDFVKPTEFGAFFPLHQRKDEVFSKAFEQCLGETEFKKLKKAPAPVVLLVDDEPSVRQTVAQILDFYGFDTLEAETGAQAIEIAKNTPLIDLKILDIGLPDIKGTELLPKLNAIHPDSETIMLTAYTNHVDYIVSAFQNQAFDYITKPYDRNDLLVKISKALQKRCFKKIMPEIGNKLLNVSLSPASKAKILQDLAKKRLAKDKQILMKDLYLFFPELESSQISKQTGIGKEIISDGIMLFVNALAHELQTGKDCSHFVEEWSQYFEQEHVSEV